MSLTFSSGPLSGHSPETVNYRIDGPAHKLLMCARTRARPPTGRSARTAASSPTPFWSYPQAEGDSAAISGYQCFRHDELTIEVGQPGEPG